MKIEIEEVEGGLILTMPGSDWKEVFITRAALFERVREWIGPTRVEREMEEASKSDRPLDAEPRELSSGILKALRTHVQEKSDEPRND